MPYLHFLLVFSRDEGKLLETDEFTSTQAALAAYSACEARYRDRKDLEIVLLGADSLETIKKTHGHYFEPDPDAQSPYLVGV